MIWTFVKKQLLLIIAKPQELLILLAMPLILTTILSFSLRSFIDGETEALHAKVAFVEYGDAEKELAEFKEKVDEANIPEQAKAVIKEQAESVMPLKVLKEDVLGDEELQDYIEYREFTGEFLEELQNSGEYTALIVVPENFHFDTLSRIFFQEDRDSQLTLLKNGDENYTVKMVEEILITFQKHFSALTVAGNYGVELRLDELERDVVGSIEMLNAKEPVQSFQYYTAAMSVMFVLFIAPYISNVVLDEKKNLVVDRILIANGTRWPYFIGTFISAIVLAFIQQMILYGVCALVFQIRFDDILAFLAINFALCVAVGGIASLLTAITFYVDSQSVANFFISFIVMTMSFLGGSFVPVHTLSPLIQSLGDYTPNGAAMETILQLMQGYGIEVVTGNAMYLIMLGLVLTMIGAISFPKRGLKT